MDVSLRSENSNQSMDIDEIRHSKVLGSALPTVLSLSKEMSYIYIVKIEKEKF